MNYKDLIRQHLKQAKVMQLATTNNDKPWVCSVYFVTDKDNNLYWLSLPTRRHSQEIENNQNVSVAITLKADLPVIGVQAEGTAEMVNNLKTIKDVLMAYIKKYGTGKSFYGRALKGINKHKLYRLQVSKFSLFDEVSFPDDSPKEWIL